MASTTKKIRTWKCGCKHCVHPGEPVTEKNGIRWKGRMWHKDCFEADHIIDSAKDIWFELMHPRSDYKDYISYGGVQNRILYKNNESYCNITPDEWLFLMKWLFCRGDRTKLTKPFILQSICKGWLTHPAHRVYNDPVKKADFEEQFEWRVRREQEKEEEKRQVQEVEDTAKKMEEEDLSVSDILKEMNSVEDDNPFSDLPFGM